MSDYFDRVEDGLRDAVRRRAHLPWYLRLVSVGRPRGLVVVLAALLVAAPAVGAATDWFGFGAPDRFAADSPTQFAGRALPATSRLLGLRVADPQGGPPWGLRLVRTTRGDTCIQLGRVEGGTLGSLGIDQAWNNDHLFHPFPNTSIGETCGTTDAAGHGFVNIAYTGVPANANPLPPGARGPQAKNCRAVSAPANDGPVCPPGSLRMIFTGLLGPDATSVTYQGPDGSPKTAPTSGSDGGYLLVVTLNDTTCTLYTHGPFGGYGPCGGSEAMMGASPGPIGAVKAITYRDGHVCRLTPPARLLAAEQALTRKLRPQSHGRTDQARRRLFVQALTRFLASRHLTRAQFGSLLHPTCPPVGYVRPNQRVLNAADVASPVTVKLLHPQYGEFQVDIAFTARQAVTTGSSWYEDYMTNPAGCSSSGQGGQIEFGNIRAGELIHDRRLIGTCKGTYHGLIGYMQNSGPIDQESAGGGTPGRDGSMIVGRFGFTIR